MALAKRVIPCLDVDLGRVVKGVNFVGIRDAGDPVEIARRYNEEGAPTRSRFSISRPATKSAIPQSTPSSRLRVRYSFR